MTVQTTLNVTAANAALKELYSDQVVQNMVYKDNPTFALMPKKTDFGGKYKPIPIIIGTSQGRSALFATAQANQTAADVESFLLTRVNDYSIAQISNELLLAAKIDKYSFIEGSQLLVNSAIRALTNSVCSALFRDGTGVIGRISDITSGVITLTNTADIVQFELNQTLRASTATTSGLRATYKGYVIAVDRSAGTVTVASDTWGGSAATPTGWTNTDYLSVDGDFGVKASGLDAWIPKSAAGLGTTFYGVTRSKDATRLAGQRLDGSAMTVEEGLVSLASKIAREGGRPNKAIVNFDTFNALLLSLGSKVMYVDLKGPAEVSFRGVKVFGANTELDVFPDRSCPATTAYVLDMSTWAICGLGDVPQILRYGDNMDMLRVYNADSAELRVGAYWNVSCNAPGWNGVLTTSE